MTSKDDPFRMGLAMLGFQHVSKREAYSNSIEVLPTVETDDTEAPRQNTNPTLLHSFSTFVLYIATVFAL